MAARPELGPVELSAQRMSSAACSGTVPWPLTCEAASATRVTSRAMSLGVRPDTVRTRVARSTPRGCAARGVATDAA